MAKRWTEGEDLIIVAYFNVVGAWIGPHDLGRSETAVVNRARFLRKSGAWEAYVAANTAQHTARVLAGHA